MPIAFHERPWPCVIGSVPVLVMEFAERDGFGIVCLLAHAVMATIWPNPDVVCIARTHATADDAGERLNTLQVLPVDDTHTSSHSVCCSPFHHGRFPR